MRKLIFLTLLWVLTFGFWISSEASLDPMQLGVGARSLAMGRVSAAMQDINSSFVNPANATALKDWGVTSMYTSLLEGDIAYTMLGGEKKFDFGTIGLSYMGSGSTGLDVTTRDADGRLTTAGSSFNYSNSVISLIYGRKLLDNLSLGATLKSFGKGFSDQTGGSGSGFDMDLGLLWKSMDNLVIGISQQNTLPASMGGKIKWGTGLEEGIPFNTKAGLAYNARKDLLFGLDVDYAQDRPVLFHGGVEWGATDFLAIRGGAEQVATSKTASTLNYTGGIGLKVKDFSFDYAYYYDNVLNANSTHYFTLSYASSAVAQKPQVKAPMFKDVPSGYWAKNEIEALAEARIITGYPDGTFRPEKILTRAEMCVLLAKAKNLEVETPKKKIFSDVDTTHWAAGYINAMVKLKLVKGYLEGDFRPEQELTREEAIKVITLLRGISLKAKDSGYKDVAGRWSSEYVSAARVAGWLKYIKGNNFEPQKPFSRAEAAYLIFQAK